MRWNLLDSFLFYMGVQSSNLSRSCSKNLHQRCRCISVVASEPPWFHRRLTLPWLLILLALVLWPPLGGFEIFGIADLSAFFVGKVTKQGIIELAIVNHLTTSFSSENVGLVFKKDSSKYWVAFVWRLAWATHVTQTTTHSFFGHHHH
jgi:hypothetical protein